MPENPESTLSSKGDDISKNCEPEMPPTPPTLVSSPKAILGLAFVSALNISCVAFIAFHLTGHADNTVQAEQIELRQGNISLEPASAYILAIPSQIEQSSPTVTQLAEEKRLVPVPTPSKQVFPSGGLSSHLDTVSENVSNETADYWVQLGALSGIEIARSYWAKLQKSHNDLLASHRPKFVGPDQVGGNLYHLRVGPLLTEPAAKLCQDLQEAGADCFCVATEGEGSERELSIRADFTGGSKP